MSKLYFYYGVMGSAKTAQALMQKFNFEENDKKVWLIKPSIDTRDCDNTNFNYENINKIKRKISSRIGLSDYVDVIENNVNIIDLFEDKFWNFEKFDIVICDEAQFLTAEQVDQLKEISDKFNIPVFCYGLKTDFKTHLFEGSKRLLEISDTIREVVCSCKCGNKANVNARLDNFGNIIVDGDQVDIGGNEKYKGMCYSCYKKEIKKHDKNK